MNFPTVVSLGHVTYVEQLLYVRVVVTGTLHNHVVWMFLQDCHDCFVAVHVAVTIMYTPDIII